MTVNRFLIDYVNVQIFQKTQRCLHPSISRLMYKYDKQSIL